MIAEYTMRELVPLWETVGRLGGGRGIGEVFMTVFDFGVTSSSEPSEASSEAIVSIRSALSKAESETQMKFGATRQQFTSSLDTNILWERWPSLFSIGLLWTETAHSGKGFFSDWEKKEFEKAQDEWISANPTEWRWISDRAPTSTKTPSGGGV